MSQSIAVHAQAVSFCRSNVDCSRQPYEHRSLSEDIKGYVSASWFIVSRALTKSASEKRLYKTVCAYRKQLIYMVAPQNLASATFYPCLVRSVVTVASHIAAAQALDEL